MAQTKAQRSASAKKAARTRKRNAAAKKGSKSRKSKRQNLFPFFQKTKYLEHYLSLQDVVTYLNQNDFLEFSSIQSHTNLCPSWLNQKIMIKEKCDRCGSSLGTETKKTKKRFCGNCKRKFQLQK